MRKLIVMALAAGLMAAGGLATNASAGVSVELLFIGHNGGAITPTNSITAVSGDTLDLGVFFSNDIQLSGIQFSINYDLQLGMSAPTTEDWIGVGLNKGNTATFAPLAAPVVNNAIGQIATYNSVLTNLSSTLRLPPSPVGGYQIGTVHFAIGNIGESHIHSGAFSPGDGAGDANFLPIPIDFFGEAVVNPVPIPEPGTAALLGLGLVGLVLAGRRNRG